MWDRCKRVLDLAGTVLIVVAAAGLVWRLYSPTAAQPAAERRAEPVRGLTVEGRSISHVRGDGRVVLVEFADYECPFCAHHARTVGASIKSRLIDSGRIQHVFFNFPLPNHSRAQKAGEAAECAALQGRFWDMYEGLFADPKRLDETDLIARAAQLGLDETAFVTCLRGGATTNLVRAHAEEGRRLGVKSTPSFFVGLRQPNGELVLQKRIVGVVPFNVIEEAVREASGSDAQAARYP